jgi:hypothetical protein
VFDLSMGGGDMKSCRGGAAGLSGMSGVSLGIIDIFCGVCDLFFSPVFIKVLPLPRDAKIADLSGRRRLGS